MSWKLAIHEIQTKNPKLEYISELKMNLIEIPFDFCFRAQKSISITTNLFTPHFLIKSGALLTENSTPHQAQLNFHIQNRRLHPPSQTRPDVDISIQRVQPQRNRDINIVPVYLDYSKLNFKKMLSNTFSKVTTNTYR